MLSPSIFGSATSANAASFSPRNRRALSQNASKPAVPNTLSRLSIGTRWVILPKPPAGIAPTFCDGLSGRIRLGNRASIALSRCRSASYSASVISGASSVLYSRSWWARSAASRASSSAASSSVRSSATFMRAGSRLPRGRLR